MAPEPTGQHHIYTGRIIHSKTPTELQILQHGSIGVLSDGTIAFLHDQAISPDDLRTKYANVGFSHASITILPRPQFLFPGLIDTHLHAPQWPNLALGMDSTLKDWIETYTDPMEASYHDTEKAKRVYRDVVKTTLRLGSTTVAYNTTMHVAATNILTDCVLREGQRAIVGKMCVTTGSTNENWEASTRESLKGSEECVRYVRKMDPEGRLVRPCVQPRGGPYCPPDLMRGLGEQVGRWEGCHVEAHMCETEADIERTLELHKGFACYSDMYRAHGLLANRTILAHCIHLQPKDIQNIVETKAGIAHNPNSNTCLRDGICHVRDLLDSGIKVGLGTDCSAGYMPSIHSAMRSASDVSRHLAMRTGEERYVLKFEELVYLATMGGANVLDMEEEVGGFGVGKRFDALVVDVRDVVGVDESLWEGEAEGDAEALVRKWVFCGDDGSIRKVFVDGKVVAGQDVA
ncbi:hypothetical protein LTR78_006140 [Recurvomyces mirabilis]|uniref:Amidohydrolase-related domain-containing protein n=1 Tax=Recurvomyces mirabilis TaxID=574656 RepID=A0AAE0WLI5_9PEZI|nr:hypothetical protein LTR78_006140 [Recurvomyces mirabilis]KAK5151982.1 hypothetical protein LTS14_008756 [Recurvomyces mirabilis]